MSLSDDFDEPTGYEAVQIVTLTTVFWRKPAASTNTNLKELPFSTLTSPDEPTHTGVAEVIPLTTAWRPLESARCNTPGVVDNVADAVRDCLPPHAQNIWEFNGHYSPGICPQDWTLGCTGAGSTINGKTIEHGETVGFCVPKTVSDIVCRNDRSKIRFFTTISQFAYDVDLIPLEVRWRKSDLSVFETTPNVRGVPGPVTKLSFQYAMSGPVDPKFRQNVKGRQAPGSGSNSFDATDTGPAGPPGAATSTSSSSPGSHPRPSATSTRPSSSPDVPSAGSPSPGPGSNGLSGGAIAGIAVGIGLVAILIALAVFFLWRRKRRLRAATGGGTTPTLGVSGIPELHGSPTGLASGGHPATAGAAGAALGVAEKDSTPIGPYLPHELSGTNPPPRPVEIPDTAQPYYTGLGAQELPTTPQPALVAPLSVQQQQQFPYTYMGATPQWQTYHGPDQPQQQQPHSPPQELGDQNSPSLTTAVTVTSYPHLPPQELGQNSPATQPAAVYPRPPPAAATAQQIYAYDTTPEAVAVPTSPTPSSSNMAYRVESEQLARLQERRQRLLELDRIDREEEELLRRMSQQQK